MVDLPLPAYLTVLELAERWNTTPQYIVRLQGMGYLRLHVPWGVIAKRIDSLATYRLATSRPTSLFAGKEKGADVSSDLLFNINVMMPIRPWGLEEIIIGAESRIDTRLFEYEGNLIQVDREFAVSISDLCVDTTHIERIEAAPCVQADHNSGDAPTIKSSSAETRNINSLLQLVIGMAVDGYGYSPHAKKSPTATEIAIALERLGTPMDVDTVRKWLKKAAAQLPEKPN